VTLSPGKSQAFQVIGRMSDGSVSQVSVAFSASGGTVSGNVYTAGSEPGVFSVIAKETLTGKADTAKVTITSSTTATLKSLELTPASVTLAPGGSQTFQTVGQMSDGSTTSVSVTFSPTGGTMSGSTYTAGSQSGTYRVIATEAGGKADTSSVTIQSATPPPPGDTRYPNEPAGLTRMFEHNFSAFPSPNIAGVNTGDLRSNGVNMSVVQDPTAPQSPNGVFQTRWPSGLQGGAEPGAWWFWNVMDKAHYMKQVYVSAWLKIPIATFESHPVFTKLMYFAHGTKQVGNADSWGLETADGMPSTASAFQIYVSAKDGDVMEKHKQNVDPTPYLTTKAWHQVEIWMDVGTLDHYDGHIKVWVDGHLVTNVTRRFLQSSTRFGDYSLPFYEAQWTPVWGGTAGAKTQTDYLWMDHLYLSGQP